MLLTAQSTNYSASYCSEAGEEHISKQATTSSTQKTVGRLMSLVILVVLVVLVLLVGMMIFGGMRIMGRAKALASRSVR